MKLLDKSTRIKDPLSLTLTASKGGWYLVSVSARVKSKKQRGKDETNDEDLTVKIDEMVFFHPRSQGRLKDSPAAFSGGQLHNKLKTVYLITYLTSGNHQITLNPQFGAEVEEVTYEKIAIEDSKVNLSMNKQAEKANDRPWITLVLDDLSLKSITAEATVKWRFPDGDDVKLITNGKIKRNPRSILHKNWIWASSILHKIFGKETREKTFQEDLPKGLHYIEFHADESPTLHKITLDLGAQPLPRGRITIEGANLRQEPTRSSSSLLTFKENDSIEVLQAAVEGEAPYKEEKNDYTNTWHKVKFRGAEGYVFSKALEIEGEDPDSVSQKIVKISKEFSLEPALALAIAKRESQFFPHAVSAKGAKGLFQIREAALKDIKDEFQPTNIFDVNQNTEAGLRYFLKLKNEYYKNDPEQELKAIAAYNAGPTAIRVGIPLSNQDLSSETQEYIKDVLEFRRQFGREKKFLLLSGLAFLLVALVGVSLARGGRHNYQTEPSRVLGDTIERSETDEFSDTRKSLVVDLNGDRINEEVVFIEKGPTPVLSWVSLYLRQGRELRFVDEIGGHFEKAQAIDLDIDGAKELMVEVISGHLVITTLYRYSEGRLEYVPEVGSKFHGLSSESSAVIANVNHGEPKELILYSSWPPDESCDSKAKIYLYRSGQLVKYLDATVAKEFCDLDPTFWGI